MRLSTFSIVVIVLSLIFHFRSSITYGLENFFPTETACSELYSPGFLFPMYISAIYDPQNHYVYPSTMTTTSSFYLCSYAVFYTTIHSPGKCIERYYGGGYSQGVINKTGWRSYFTITGEPFDCPADCEEKYQQIIHQCGGDSKDVDWSDWSFATCSGAKCGIVPKLQFGGFCHAD